MGPPPYRARTGHVVESQIGLAYLPLLSVNLGN